MKSTLFRVDGSPHLGMGHIMRCLAFAQGLEKIGIDSIFVIRDYDQKIDKIIRRYGYEVEVMPHDSTFTKDATLTLEFVSQHALKLGEEYRKRR